jgi:Phosphatase-1 catalytic subunit binding region
MGTVRTIIRTNRRESPTDSGESVCKILHPHRREVARVGDDGLRMCGHSTILLSSDSRTPTEQAGNRSTPQRMEHVEGDHSTGAHEVPSAEHNANVLVASRPLQSGGSALVPRMFSLSIGRNVSFDSNVTVYTPNDWSPRTYRNARKGPWMQHAVDRCRFRRRIKQTEIDLGEIFSDDNRDRVKRRLFHE